MLVVVACADHPGANSIRQMTWVNTVCTSIWLLVAHESNVAAQSSAGPLWHMLEVAKSSKQLHLQSAMLREMMHICNALTIYESPGEAVALT